MKNVSRNTAQCEMVNVEGRRKKNASDMNVIEYLGKFPNEKSICNLYTVHDYVWRVPANCVRSCTTLRWQCCTKEN